ncbi:hypothetical protein MHO82_22395 [Vibrio sp. Of7-15]|uniref:hypothetical protein n=1 Tax=Vibrio sp. Of7-15 TaxID=2724879 RepID=UPI001EF2401A|nr:hypothetical protein [Vibrio sp. Of7-15]MCG7499619.1 hypothetical protein [Vibrio sp. Of7-15]
MEHYIKHIKNEPAVMEWEADLWERGEREIALGFLLFLFSLTMSTYFFIEDPAGQVLFRWIGIGMMALLGFSAAMHLAPERYYHKITSTGVYVYSYKRGKAYREALVKGFLIAGGIAAVVLLFILGPMAFAGAGGGTLGLFKLAAMVKDKPPKERALPWEAIYTMSYCEEDRWFDKERVIDLQAHGMLHCSVENYEQVKLCIEPYLREDIYVMKDYFSECQKPSYLKVEDKIKTELEFILGGLPD